MFTPEQKLRNFDYYEGITVRDSSLSPATQAVMAAEVGHLNLAYDYLAEAAFMDLQDREHNTKDGLHIASLAGAWTALISGFGGMRAVKGQLCFSPKLPPGIVRLVFRLRYRGRTLRVEVHGQSATYSLLSGEPLDVLHYLDTVTIGDKEVSLDIPAIVPPPPPTQPYGRVPQPHRARSS
jgi:alpha,alpha-trehalose phosphorylase